MIPPVGEAIIFAVHHAEPGDMIAIIERATRTTRRSMVSAIISE